MLGFIGGTGPEGRGLALRLALAGETVVIGSRDPERARQAAQEVLAQAPGATVLGMENRECARTASLLFLTVPFSAHRQVLEVLRDLLAGKILVDVVAPVQVVQGRARAVPVEEGSAAQQAQRLVPTARVVAAFHTVSAQDLLHPGRPVEADVVVCSDDPEAKRLVMALAEKIPGLRAVDGDGLECARYVEELTALLLTINRIYRARSMIRIVGLPERGGM